VLKPPAAHYVQHDSTIDQISSRPELFALTCYLSVELPGIESAYNSVDLREQKTSQHGSTWMFTSVDEHSVDPRQHATALDMRQQAPPNCLLDEVRFPTFCRGMAGIRLSLRAFIDDRSTRCFANHVEGLGKCADITGVVVAMQRHSYSIESCAGDDPVLLVKHAPYPASVKVGVTK
jgi:hypothetical protein